MTLLVNKKFHSLGHNTNQPCWLDKCNSHLSLSYYIILRWIKM